MVMEPTFPRAMQSAASRIPHPTKKRHLADQWRLTFNPDGRHLGEGGGSLSKTGVHLRGLVVVSFIGVEGLGVWRL